MDIGGKNLIEESPCCASGDCQDTKAKIDYVDLSTIAKMPATPNRGRKRQLTRSRHLETFSPSHPTTVLG